MEHGDRVRVATRKGLFTLERAGSGRWQIGRMSFIGDPVTIVLDDRRDGSLYAALNLGHFGVKLRRSRDGGETWDELVHPAFPEQENGPSVHQIWSLEPGGDDRPGRLWAGTIPAGLWRSENHGDSWRLVEPLWNRPERANWFGGGYDEAGIHSICVDPRDSNALAVGVSCGGVWISNDSGETWECRTRGMYAAYMPPERREDPDIQDPHRVSQCAGAPDVLWVQHHNGVFRSTDRARQWRELADIEPSTFGFAVAAHPTDPRTAWFVPAVKDECRVPVGGRVVVTRTRDGGESFEVLDRGLPQQH
ncbi:MAG TPA: hypothetical protein VD788_12465, partial [Candidatus Polarisedimenticolaceae bacterium]|nr:hypothetical protein [Candidatus Polarisedimenticolaceae bacterium]